MLSVVTCHVAYTIKIVPVFIFTNKYHYFFKIPIDQNIIICHQNCIEANFNFLYNNCAVLGDDSEKRLPADEETAVSPATQDLEFWVKLKQLVVYFIEEDRDIYTHHLNQ